MLFLFLWNLYNYPGALMIKEIEILVEMQKRDDIISEKDILTETLPRELNSLIKNLEEADLVQENTKNELDENSTTQKLKELDIKDNNEHIEKYKNQLLTIKTNKEYKALNSEVSHLETKNSQIDDELIVLMEEETVLRDNLKEAEIKQKYAEEQLKANEEKLKRKIEQVKKDIEEIREKRNELARNLPRQLVKRYGALIRNKGKKAVVFNIKNACSGCGYTIRPQLVIEIREGNKIVSCENCGRMLVSESKD